MPDAARKHSSIFDLSVMSVYDVFIFWFTCPHSVLISVLNVMSVNGTFVNGERINVRYFTDSDVLRFGPVECLFVVPAGFKEPKKSSKNKEKSLPIWKIALHE